MSLMRLKVLSTVFCVAALCLTQAAFGKVFSMAVKATTPGPQILDLRGGAKVQANLPAGYRLAALALPQRVTYMFLGPDNKNGEHAVMSVDVLPVTAKLSSPKAVFETVFAAYSAGTNDFKSTISKPFSVNGINFDRANFEGTMDGVRSKGFAVVTRLKQGFCVMVARDKESDFKRTEPVLMSVVNSCRLNSR